MKSLRVFFAVIVILSCAVITHAKPSVLFIESYHSDYKWDREMSRGLEAVLGDKVELYNFQMDTKRLPVSEYSKRADLAWQYYLEVNPDIVILGDDNALSLLAESFLATDTPVVYMGINSNPRRYAPLGKNITGVLERPLYKRTVKYLKELLFIGKGKVLVLLDESTTSRAFKTAIFNGEEGLEISGIKTDVEFISSLENWKRSVLDAHKNNYKAIVIGLYHRIFEDGKYVDSEKILEWTSANSPVPVFAFWEMSVGKGKAAGGMVTNGEVQGIAAGKIVRDILNGTPVKSIRPVIPKQGRFIFSRAELDRWKIRLPRYISERSHFVE